MSSFGDRVRIKETPETEAAGIAGLEGDIYGITMPSVTNVEVIGGAPKDCALNVLLENRKATVWVRPDLVEVLHHNPGMEIVLGKVRTVRQADGSWIKSVKNPSQPAKDRTGLWQRLKSLFHR